MSSPRRSSSSAVPTLELDTNRAQLDGLVESVLSQVRGISREDAQDAVQEAWIVLSEKAADLEPGPIGGYLMRTARFKALGIRDRSSKTRSLDAMVEAAGDSAVALMDRKQPALEAGLELNELESDPIAARAVAAARDGAAAQIAPRGINHPSGRYADEQIAQVRALRRRGLSYVEIERRTGVPAGYCHQVVTRKARVTESGEGWSPRLVIECLRRFQREAGRVPRYRDLERNPAMPSPQTARRIFGSWVAALRAAGLEPAYGDRRSEPWSLAEMAAAFCEWRLRRCRWPDRKDMTKDASLPSPATVRRHFGSQSPDKIADRVLAMLA